MKETVKIENAQDEMIGIYNEKDEYIGKATRKEMWQKKLTHRCTCIIVINDKKEILVQTRSLNKDFCPGYLDTVIGGRVKDGENVDESAERELFEELGINVKENNKKLNFFGKHFFEDTKCKIWAYQYYIFLNEEEVKKITFKDKEVSKIEWHCLNDIYELKQNQKIKIIPSCFQILNNLEKLKIL